MILAFAEGKLVPLGVVTGTLTFPGACADDTGERLRRVVDDFGGLSLDPPFDGGVCVIAG